MSAKRFKLELTQEAFEELHEAAERARRSSSTVKVCKAALVALLKDHGRLVRLHEGRIEP